MAACSSLAESQRIWPRSEETLSMMMTSLRPPRASTSPTRSRSVPTMNPMKVAMPVTSAPPAPAPTAAQISVPGSEFATISVTARPDKRNADSGRANVQAPNTRNPRPSARRAVGAATQSSPQANTEATRAMAVVCLALPARAAAAGDSITADRMPNTIPTMSRKAKATTDITRLHEYLRLSGAKAAGQVNGISAAACGGAKRSDITHPLTAAIVGIS